MTQQRFQSPLITTRRGAIVAFCLAICLLANRFRLTVSHRAPRIGEHIAIDSIRQHWLSASFQAWLFVVFAWFLVLALKHYKGAERAYLALLCFACSIGPVKVFAAGLISSSISWLQVTAELGMVGAAIAIYECVPPARDSEQAQQPPQTT